MQSTQIKEVELRPLYDNDKDFELIERKIRSIFKKEIYLPLINELGEKHVTLRNSSSPLLEAIRTGRIEYYRGEFSGRFNASISKEIKALGAQWDRKTWTWKIPQSSLPLEVRNAISASISNFQTKMNRIDQRLAQILPEEIADKLKIADHFDATLWKVEKNLHGTLKHLSVPAQLSAAQKKTIAEEWQNNLKLYIKNWTQDEIVKLRKDLQQVVFTGNRHEAAIKVIQKSHDVGVNKARFLARQETRLLLTKFKQSRYEDAGVEWYRWGISNHQIQPKGAPYKKGEVRHDHGILDGKKFRWNAPPITNTETGARNNPGQDYNCRCFAVPIVRFKDGG